MSTEGTDPNGMSLAFIEGLYEDYLRDRSSVSEDWGSYFDSLNGSSRVSAKPGVGPSFSPPSLFNPRGGNGQGGHVVDERVTRMASLQHRVDNLVRNYRVRGHLIACENAIGSPAPDLPELESSYHGFTEEDLDTPFSAELLAQEEALTLREIITRLQNTYCRSIGAQFMHIDELEVRDWLQKRMEGTENRFAVSRELQMRILRRLTDATTFEQFIQRKFPGAKSFSLEGAESLIPLLELAIDMAGEHGVNHIVMGMAHRGRLNVLANVMGKDPAQIFREYEDKDPDEYTGQGDVKYHLGCHTDWEMSEGRKVQIALCFNPSHLEYVNPVACGRMRSWQDRTGDANYENGMVFLIHGDAAFAGEGIVQETLNMSSLKPYTTGGTLHIIVNNQIGFTTDPRDSRSSVYCTDVAKMLQSPIFHVDGEDPEAVAQVISLAMNFRKAFQRDVVIDMYCYRKRGHNEGDEPAFTQPLMYREIEKRRSVRDTYLDGLLNMGDVTREEAEQAAADSSTLLEKALTEARTKQQVRPPSMLRELWKGYKGGPDIDVPSVETGVEREQLASLINSLTTLPQDFTPHPKIARMLKQRKKMASGEIPLDWAMCEALALATLTTEGSPIRLTGQDSQRGTFSHRHAVLHDYQTDELYTPLANLSPDQGRLDIHNSPLSEAGVLGFEYGYSLANPDGLTMWEAQFGDFSNAGQVIFDQFISSAEDKWRSLSGLVVLLPHGFEGMGPEHSSARLERFLGLAAEDNIQVCVPTTPAQLFHLLRRQVHRPWRKPLIAMTPKSLLRHPMAISGLDELSSGGFQRILPDRKGHVEGVTRILMCSGKICFELETERDETEREDIAILRVEQLYPLQPPDLEVVLSKYKTDTPIYWVQEEPENMGAWRRMKGKFGERLLGRFPFTGVCRPASASPATGSAHSHRLEQREIITNAFGTQKTSWF